MDVEDWVSRCSTIVVDECPDRYDLTLRSLRCRRVKLQSQRVERRKWERERGGRKRTKELEEGKNKCDIRLQGQSAWECRTGGRVGLWAGSCTVVDTIRQGRQGPAQSTRMGPNQHQGTANHSDYQRARLMHKTNIRVVDGNGWRRNSYAGSRRQLSLVGGPDGDAFFQWEGRGLWARTTWRGAH